MSVHDTVENESVAQSTELTTDDVAVADTGSGLLVFEVETEYRGHTGRHHETARTLVGFADVSDWSVVADALRSRGIGVGATTNLPVFSLDELPATDE